MKDIYLILIVFLLIPTSIFSQIRDKQFAVYSTLGVKATMGASFIHNRNMEADFNLDFRSGLYYASGIKTSISYIGKSSINSLYGIHFDYLRGAYPIKFKNIKTDIGDYTKAVNLKTNNYVFTFRLTNVKGKWFVEAGPQFTKFRSIKQTNEGIDSSLDYLISNYNYESNYQNYTSLVLGAGIFVRGVVVSLRYTASVISIAKSGSNPIKDGYFSNSMVNSTYNRKYSSSVKTMHNTFQLTIEYYISFLKFKRNSRGVTGFSFFKDIDTSYYWGK